ncbi:TetR family transcriptional regulator C-terminal domain-containing protein [Micromonospora craniellae]|uniref:BetI-type transcriptional repressor C-terminal domain-containing protein n=1 Tax=Micromonospora craniellae TaxID=2294034 RepID=A0A372G1F3_9ACTN|nr:TetR family transcriptional regulator C-terminal domain-containing protein [Micromonospora craniellae]QOC91651.1 TetR family transcriptional regulator C-terminal domain-containing protein [Micromonospora craniellae]RFS46569.1 hypothetical protein D0Q02_10775 [Micromonospora craniellae]
MVTRYRHDRTESGAYPARWWGQARPGGGGIVRTRRCRDPWRMLMEFWIAAAHDAELRAHAAVLAEQYRQPFVEAVQRGVDSGSFAPRFAVPAVVDVLVATMDGLLYPLVLGHRGSAENGVDRVFLIVPGGDDGHRSVTGLGSAVRAFLDLAQSREVKRVVLMTALGMGHAPAEVEQRACAS